jgi:hypothetical protein
LIKAIYSPLLNAFHISSKKDKRAASEASGRKARAFSDNFNAKDKKNPGRHNAAPNRMDSYK